MLMAHTATQITVITCGEDTFKSLENVGRYTSIISYTSQISSKLH